MWVPTPNAQWDHAGAGEAEGGRSTRFQGWFWKAPPIVGSAARVVHGVPELPGSVGGASGCWGRFWRWRWGFCGPACLGDVSVECRGWYGGAAAPTPAGRGRRGGSCCAWRRIRNWGTMGSSPRVKYRIQSLATMSWRIEGVLVHGRYILHAPVAEGHPAHPVSYSPLPRERRGILSAS